MAIARQVAEALEAAHEAGIVHRDLKPANIKLRPDGSVKVLDFGLAKAIGGHSAIGAECPDLTTALGDVTAPGLILGTAAYMAPEQARGRTVDKRADIWAFGVVAWEMLTGRPLFAGETRHRHARRRAHARDRLEPVAGFDAARPRRPAAALSRARSEEAPARHRRRQARRQRPGDGVSRPVRRRQPPGAGGCGDWRCRRHSPPVSRSGGSVPAWWQGPRRGKCGSRSRRTTRAPRRSRPTGRWQSWRRAARCGCATSSAWRCES